MRRRRNKGLGELLFATTGWLFADLFVALTMGFLVANTFPQVVPPVPTPTPSPTPIPTVIQGINKNPIQLTIPIDHVGLLNGDQIAITNAEQQVLGMLTSSGLQGKRAGVVETYGGTQDEGTAIANAFNTEVLTDLGNQNIVFWGDPLYQSFFVIGQDIDQVVVLVFVYNYT